MTDRATYAPGPAAGARVQKGEGPTWTLILTRDMRHPPELVWQAITDPAHLKEWAPFDADGNLGRPGASVRLTTVGAPQAQVTETTIKRAVPPRLLEFTWGGNEIRWELEPHAGGTRLTLWHNIDKGFIAWGAAGWHICLDVLDLALGGQPIGRIVGPDAMQFKGWQELTGQYAKQFRAEEG